MYQSPEFQRFVGSEQDAERHAAISALVAREPTWQRNLLLWQVLGLLPSRLEKSRMAHALRMPPLPGSEWAMVSYLLTDADQDIIGNAINSLNFSRNRALAHRLLRFFALPERPQRVLYCLARYAEETMDQRMASHIAPFLQSELSDAFLARSFNALFRLGVKDRTALRVAGELVASHVDATNMDRKAAVSAVVYLCFAGSREDMAQLRKVRDGVTIPELRRLLNWGFADISQTCSERFDEADAKAFFERATREAEPNFSGFGSFDDDVLARGLATFLGSTKEDAAAVTRTVLALGHAPCVELLATHERFSVAKALSDAASGNGTVRDLWCQFMPIQSATFLASVRSPANHSDWTATGPDALFICLRAQDFTIGAGAAGWQDVFEAELASDPKTATNVLCAQLLALEKEHLLGAAGDKDAARSLEARIFSNVDAIFAESPRPGAAGTVGAAAGAAAVAATASGAIDPRKKGVAKPSGKETSKDANKETGKDPGRPAGSPGADRPLSTALRQEITDRVYGVLVGGAFPPAFLLSVFGKAPFSATSWAFNAFALSAPEIDRATLKEAIRGELEAILGQMKGGAMAREDYLLEVVSRFQGILVGSERFQLPVSQENLEAVQVLATTIHTIIEAVDSEAAASGNARPGHEDDDEEGADWSGHVAIDKPLLRWNAIIQTCQRKEFSLEQRAEYEAILKEAMRVAPHVEKRWVVRSLVKLGSDDAVKAILYQALQHVDADFVAHTIRELLPSKHPRAQQALIRCVGRNSVSDDLKLMILEEISLENPQEILQELRTLEILRLPQHIDDAIRDAVGRVAALIDVDTQLHTRQSEGGADASRVTGADLELIIKKLLPDADSLSVDVKSALRTAEMILIQSRQWNAEAVDLSPIVNMHSKAVELTLRETFEPFTDAVIRKGVLSRKLDVLGYARPIPEKMEVFENALAALPVIKTIPYFSKFKLRKMLRAICLYRSGKRFTLDGPKAFALLFLVISRKQCTFGLERILPLDFATDTELFEFIKLVHSLQDSRNRAVHEGLTWDAKDEIESMRSQAYKIIDICMRQGRYLKKVIGQGGASGGGQGSGRLDMGA